MNDKEYNAQKKRIRKLKKKWHEALGLNWWRVTYVYSRESRDGTPVSYDNGNDWDIAATCECDSNYMTATITFFLPQLVNIEDEELEEIFLHECMHILINPMRHKNRSAEEERVATTLARSVIWATQDLVKAALKEKKKKTTSRRPLKMPQKRLKKKKAK